MAWLGIVVAAISAMLVLPGVALANQRVALVIGNSAYVNAPALANPANDAKTIAEALRSVGFTVVVGLDLDKSGFEKALRTFTRELAKADTGLFFYAGHGLQIAGQNYLVPVDAALAVERDVDFEAIRVDFILKQMELDRDGKTNIIFLDACRDNPLAKNLARTMGTRSAAISQGLAEIKTGVGTFIAYSTQPGNVALDGAGLNSPFAAALAQRLVEPDQALTSVSIKVRNDVLAATAGKQVPWDHSALTGEFYFTRVTLQGLPRPELSGSGGDAMKERLARLEEELKRRSETSQRAATATLMQLRQRQRQLEDDNRRAQDRIFAIQREGLRETDQTKRMSNFQEIGRVQVDMSRRATDIKELKAEIARLEADVPSSANSVSDSPKP